MQVEKLDVTIMQVENASREVGRVGQIRMSINIRRIIQGGGGGLYIPYFLYQKSIDIIQRIYAVYIRIFGKNTVKN